MAKALEVYLRDYPAADEAAALARMAEAAGWDGLLFMDSQNLVHEVFGALYLAAAATTRLHIGTAVTNGVTRHPAVLAAAFATLQHISAGRAHLGIARGDTALELLGLHPPSPDEFAHLLATVQAHLRGEAVDVNGFASRITWLPGAGQPKVPLNVFATGSHTIEVGARLGDRLTVAVGAEPERVRWAVDHARAARTAAGLPADDFSIGAFVVAAAGTDAAALHTLVRANASISAHFQRGSRPLLSPADRSVVAAVTEHYDNYHHGLEQAPQAESLPDDFLDRFTVVGTPDACVTRLQALVALGLDHLVIVGPSRDVPPAIRERSYRLFATEVLPALRAS